MIKIEMLSHNKKFTKLYQVVGIKDRRLCLLCLENKEIYYERTNPSFKIYYHKDIGNYIVNSANQKKIPIDKILKDFFNEFYFKGEKNV